MNLEPHERFEGVHARPDGQVDLEGPALALFEALDRLIVAWSSRWQAHEMRFAPFLPAADLGRLDYFGSFPHLATFPVALDAEAANLADFAADPLSGDGRLQLTRTAPVREILTPAACYPVYRRLEGTDLDAPYHVTTRCACFRREERYLPLRRQWSFTMREVVCLGTDAEVQAFLEDWRDTISGLARALDLDGRWAHATDPFFDPKSPKLLLQKVAVIKQELRFADDLAIASTNAHGPFFGQAFDLRRDGQTLVSGCVAFGLERWLYALGTRWGMQGALERLQTQLAGAGRVR